MSLHQLFKRELSNTPEEKQLINAEAVAQIAHTANSEHCRLMGEKTITWEDLDEVTKKGVIAAVQKISNSNGCITPWQLHEDWVEFKTKAGWTYGQGPVDRVRKTHPCLTPWEKLSNLQRLKDILFYNIVMSYCVFQTKPYSIGEMQNQEEVDSSI